MAFQGLFGIVVFIVVAFLLSESRWEISWKKVISAIILQVSLAVIFLKIPQAQGAFLFIAKGVSVLKEATMSGTQFVFGYLGGGDVPFAIKEGAGTFTFILMFQALPMIMVISALSMLLFHWGVLQFIIKGISVVTQRVLHIGGALGACSAAKVFFGQETVPLLVRPYLAHFSRNELFSVMAAGMATTSMTLMVLYGSFLEKLIDGSPITHILTSSIINVPAALMIAELMVPARGKLTSGQLVVPYEFNGAMQAVSQGTEDGLKLVWGIAANLVVVLAIVFIINKIIGSVSLMTIGRAITMQEIFGYLFFPVAWLIGIPASEAASAGGLLATKTVLNEIAAMIDLAKMPAGTLSSNSVIIMTYALCGFANFSSIAIQLGSIGSLIPERRKELMELCPKALIAGTMASCLSGALISIIYSLS